MDKPYLPYAGIGSRKTPSAILHMMSNFATHLERRGWTMRSGGANGADSAFEAGIQISNQNKEIYLPWGKFNGNSSPLTKPSEQAMIIAEQFHPAWDKCSDGAKLLHARNVHQMLGRYLATPSLFVICWTPDGNISGGTGQALRMANSFNIPVFNMGTPNFSFDIIDQITQLESLNGLSNSNGIGRSVR